MTLPYTEADLDSGTEQVRILDLVNVTLKDDDGSETLTLRVTGLPDGFAPSVGTLLTPEAEGADRVWVLKASDLATATIAVPENFSGEVTFQVIPVTTENDGNSLTGVPVDVSFTVTPSPEAEITESAVLVEDVATPLNIAILHQNGDTDEVLAAIRIRVEDAEGDGYSLLMNGVPLADAEGVETVTDEGVAYYVLTPEQAGQLAALTAEHRDGDLGSFQIQYQITDPGGEGVDPVTSDWLNTPFTLTATAVTDQPTLEVSDITGADTIDGTDVTLNSPGQVTVNLNVGSPDHDGSEHVVRVIIDGVPSGVTVEGAEAVGANSWLLVYEGTDALPIDAEGGIILPVIFDVGENAGGIDAAPISITVQVQDNGDQANPGTSVEEVRIDGTLTTAFDAGEGELPPLIDEWAYTDASATEDVSFALSDMVNAGITLQSGDVPNTLTITLTDLPSGTEVEGMTRTMIGGVETWTASVTTPAGATSAEAQTALEGLMNGITIRPPANSNENNNPEGFTLNAQLTTVAAGGSQAESRTVEPTIPVSPVTDPAEITVALGAADENGRLTESDTEIPITIHLNNPADGEAGQVIDGNLYLQISADQPGLQGGTVTVGGTTYELEPVSGIDGLPDGAYYVIPGVSMDDHSVELVYTPDDMVVGNVTVNAWVQHNETDAATIVSTSGTVLTVEVDNNGVTVSAPAVSGNEAATANDRGSLIPLNLTVTLNDADSEQITAIMLAGLPDGFLVYTGEDAENATESSMASNAGGAAGVNTWILSNGALPPYIAILPPQYWSGTLDDLELIVTSGETTLSEKLTETVDIGAVTINPVANGIELTKTSAFGTEGKIIPLNLNASMNDAGDASVDAAPDESQETVTLELTGLGEHAAFYVGGVLLTEGVSYDGGTYTLTGLTQAQLDGLGFVQAASALTDQNLDEAGLQIGVTAWTVDGESVSAEDSETVTLNVMAQRATTGNDTLIWTGLAINGRGGNDTVQFRIGESLTGAELDAQLSNIEVLDLGIAGENAIKDLTPDQLVGISGSTALAINGTSEDSISLSGDWRDNGDGTYTGTRTAGGDVTLTVNGDAEVTPPAEGFQTDGMEGLMAPMSFGLGGDVFGLAGLDGSVAPDGANDGTAAELPDLNDLFFGDEQGQESLSDLLPEEDAPASAATDSPANSPLGSDADNLADWAEPAPLAALEDETPVLFEV